jgi:subtilisin family serine protease
MRHWGRTAIKAHEIHLDASGVTVAIVDSGVDRGHPDLAAAIEDYVNKTAEGPQDKTGHGTHVCGIIAGRGTEPDGMPGVSNARLIVFKALVEPHDPHAYYEALGDAIDRAQVINLSLGGPDEDPTENILIEYAIEQGVTVVAAMGNDGVDIPHYPAALPGVIAVGAVDEALERADFSNIGNHIRLVAPGVQIWSTTPKQSSLFGATTGYASCNGTSMATPFVSGTVALLLAGGPRSPAQIKDALAARYCAGQTCPTPELGSGILDAASTLINDMVDNVAPGEAPSHDGGGLEDPPDSY